MTSRSCKTRDGQTVRDGESTVLVLMYDTAEVTVTGVVRFFEEDGESRWEISTSDPQHPAVGFRTENVKTKIEN